MIRMIGFVGCLLFMGGGVGCALVASQPPVYGAKVPYALHQPLTFPNFTLEFLGQREVSASPQFPRAIRVYEFKVTQDTQSQIITWSAGTGDIGPTQFVVDGQTYWLELRLSDKLGPLAEHELVVWRE
ncbi:MAG: hypothetical protein R3C14_53230 [Caldilineaceae bacterium]